jgi:uncharacterized protein YpiB (UPF0302 family)
VFFFYKYKRKFQTSNSVHNQNQYNHDFSIREPLIFSNQNSSDTKAQVCQSQSTSNKRFQSIAALIAQELLKTALQTTFDLHAYRFQTKGLNSNKIIHKCQ